MGAASGWSCTGACRAHGERGTVQPRGGEFRLDRIAAGGASGSRRGTSQQWDRFDRRRGGRHGLIQRRVVLGLWAEKNPGANRLRAWRKRRSREFGDAKGEEAWRHSFL